MKKSRLWVTVILPAIIGLACSESNSPAVSYQSPGPCDGSVTIASTDALDAARAIGMCDGVVSAAWVHPDGTSATLSVDYHLGHGLLGGFGANNAPGEGVKLLALSSGRARAPSDPGFGAALNKGFSSPLPAGYPKGDPQCTAPNASGYDGVALRVVLVVPAGVRHFSFDYAYFTRDYPQWVCTAYIDQAAALVTGITGSAGVRNLLIDAAGNPMFASTTSMTACTAGQANSQNFTCPLGTAVLLGTGFENFGSTGWLSTSNLLVTARDTVRMTFTIWDNGDGAYDSSVLIDNFKWIP